MSLQVRPLSSTWFHELDLRGLHIAARLPSEEQQSKWKAAVDERKGVLVTNLLGASHEMRDGTYFYLLAIARRLYLLEASAGSVRVAQAALAGAYPSVGAEPATADVLDWGRRGIRLLFESHSHSSRPGAGILDARGHPIGSKDTP